MTGYDPVAMHQLCNGEHDNPLWIGVKRLMNGGVRIETGGTGVETTLCLNQVEVVQLAAVLLQAVQKDTLKRYPGLADDLWTHASKLFNL